MSEHNWEHGRQHRGYSHAGIPPECRACRDITQPFTLVELPCGCQDVHYEDGTIDREHDHVECDGTPLAEAGR